MLQRSICFNGLVRKLIVVEIWIDYAGSVSLSILVLITITAKKSKILAFSWERTQLTFTARIVFFLFFIKHFNVVFWPQAEVLLSVCYCLSIFYAGRIYKKLHLKSLFVKLCSFHSFYTLSFSFFFFLSTSAASPSLSVQPNSKNGHAFPRFIIWGLCQTQTVIWKGQRLAKRFKSPPQKSNSPWQAEPENW